MPRRVLFGQRVVCQLVSNAVCAKILVEVDVALNLEPRKSEIFDETKIVGAVGGVVAVVVRMLSLPWLVRFGLGINID
jgi:hypothetical protein